METTQKAAEINEDSLEQPTEKNKRSDLLLKMGKEFGKKMTEIFANNLDAFSKGNGGRICRDKKDMKDVVENL